MASDDVRAGRIIALNEVGARERDVVAAREMCEHGTIFAQEIFAGHGQRPMDAPPAGGHQRLAARLKQLP
jgi:hypothetical protein